MHMIVNYPDQGISEKKSSIFLAGTTHRKEWSVLWRKRVCGKLQKMGFMA